MSTQENTTDQNLAIINQVEAGLTALEESCKELPDFTTDEGYARAKELRKPIVKARTTGDKARLAATADLRTQVKSINSMWADKILPRIEAIEAPLTDGIKAVDDERARIEREAAEAEQSRISGIEAHIASIKAMPSTAITLEQISSANEKLNEFKSSGTYDIFDEFKDAARGFIEEAEIALNIKRVTLEEQAAEAIRLADQKAEQERIAAEQKEKQDKIDAQLKEIEDAKAAEEQRKADEAAEAKRKQEQEAREKALAEQAEKDKAAAVESARIAEQSRIEAERLATEKREADEKAERDRVAALAPDADKLRAWFDSVPELVAIESEDAEVMAVHSTIKNSLKKMSAAIASLPSSVDEAA